MMRPIQIILCLVFYSALLFPAHSQNNEWITFDIDNSVYALAEEGGYIWAGTSTGLVQINKISGELTFYDNSNSDLPEGEVYSIAIEKNGDKWVGIRNGGLVRLSGTTWDIYDTTNSNLPHNHVRSIVIDSVNTKWIGTFGGGVARFDGNTWTVFDSSNSGLPYDQVRAIAIDSSGNKWIGTWSGLAKYDGSAWQVYTVHNSGLINNYIYSINIDGTGNIWIGSDAMAAVMFDGENWEWYFDNDHEYAGDTYNVTAFEQDSIVWFGRDRGLSRFKGTLWEFYNISNSGLPNSNVFSILVDDIGNKWIGTREGLAVYNEEGVVQVENQTQNIVKSYSLLQNYPNPFNPTTNINYELPMTNYVDLSIYNSLGQKVVNLISKKQAAGTYEVEWNAAEFASGIYFFKIQAGEFVDMKKMILLR